MDRSVWQRRPQAVVYAVGPVGGRDRQHELYDLVLVEVLTDRLEVNVVNVARPARQQVCEAKDRPLCGIEETRVTSTARFAQCCDLLIVVAAPPRRGSV